MEWIKLTAIATMCAGALVTANLANSSLQYDAPASEIEQQVKSSFIVQGFSEVTATSYVRNVGGSVKREFPIINAVSADLTDAQVAILKSYKGLTVSEDRTVESMSLTQLSPSYAIDNYISSQVEANRLHNIGIKGNGVTVAVLDSGTNMGGRDGSYIFRNSKGSQKVAVKYDALRGHPTYYYNDDQNGHGSHVTGIIGSSLRDSKGHFNGIAPDAHILSIRAFDNNGQSSYTLVLDALNWIYDNRLKYKIRVVNMSLGSAVQSRYWQDPINQAVMKLWHAGVVVVASAGNNGEDLGITVPGNNPYVLTVGAMSDNKTPYDYSDDRVASFSAKGPTLDGFVKPDVLAPGTSISVKMNDNYIVQKLRENLLGVNYVDISGTSQSAAVVSGIAALVLQQYPNISPDDVKCKIMSAAKARISDDKLAYSPFAQGAGLVNAYSAVMSSASGCANQGLDIEADLTGEKRFIGPVEMDNNGEYVIPLLNGDVWTKGSHWSQSALDLQGAHWGNTQMDLFGAHWGNQSLDLLGSHWGVTQLDLLGAHWGNANLDLLGSHWSVGSMLLQGSHWSTDGLNLLSADEPVEPIDPNVVIPVDDSGWQ